MMNKITTVNHIWNGRPRTRTRTEVIIIHHTDSHDVSTKTIHQWHLDRGWMGIGYHFLIRQNGNIETGRPMNSIGSHAGPKANGMSIGVSLTGRLDKEPPKPKQMASLVWLIQEHIWKTYGYLPIKGHKDFMSTSCPGRHFSMVLLEKMLEEKEEKDMPRYQKVSDMPGWMQPHVRRLIAQKVLIESEQMNLTEDMVRTILIVERLVGGKK